MNLTINPATEANRIRAFIRKVISRSGRDKVVVAVSGGVDSAVVLTLATQALGTERVLALKLPYLKFSPRATSNADLVIEKLRLPDANVLTVTIAAAADSIWKVILSHPFPSHQARMPTIKHIRFGNILARVRMIYLFDLAQARNALVCGTENRSEHLLGYFTRFGDEASDLEPLRHLYKTQVFALAQYLALPFPIIDQAPTAGLWAGQTDEKELDFTYANADQILYLTFDRNVSPSAVARTLARHHPTKPLEYWKTQTKKVLERVALYRFKRELPYSLEK